MVVIVNRYWKVILWGFGVYCYYLHGFGSSVYVLFIKDLIFLFEFIGNWIVFMCLYLLVIVHQS